MGSNMSSTEVMSIQLAKTSACLGKTVPILLAPRHQPLLLGFVLHRSTHDTLRGILRQDTLGKDGRR